MLYVIESKNHEKMMRRKKMIYLCAMLMLMITSLFAILGLAYKEWVSCELVPGLRFEYIRGEFDSSEFINFCEENGYSREYEGKKAKTPKQAVELVDSYYYDTLWPENEETTILDVHYDEDAKLWFINLRPDGWTIGSPAIFTVSAETGVITEWHTGLK